MSLFEQTNVIVCKIGWQQFCHSFLMEPSQKEMCDYPLENGGKIAPGNSLSVFV